VYQFKVLRDGRKSHEATRRATSNRAGTAARLVDEDGPFFQELATLVLFVWVALAAFSPFFEASQSSVMEMSGAVSAVAFTTSAVLSGSELRLDPRFGSSLYMYVNRRVYEDLPYPDRTQVVEVIGKVWCKNVGQILAPRVNIYDIRSGDKLAGYYCVLNDVGNRLRRVLSK
jgi:hypothetical protein